MKNIDTVTLAVGREDSPSATFSVILRVKLIDLLFLSSAVVPSACRLLQHNMRPMLIAQSRLRSYITSALFRVA